jgi:hypothetical protein
LQGATARGDGGAEVGGSQEGIFECAAAQDAAAQEFGVEAGADWVAVAAGQLRGERGSGRLVQVGEAIGRQVGAGGENTLDILAREQLRHLALLAQLFEDIGDESAENRRRAVGLFVHAGSPLVAPIAGLTDRVMLAA